MANSADPDQLASLLIWIYTVLQRQGISGFSRTRVKLSVYIPSYADLFFHLSALKSKILFIYLFIYLLKSKILFIYLFICLFIHLFQNINATR